jgi:hypothetical protein
MVQSKRRLLYIREKNLSHKTKNPLFHLVPCHEIEGTGVAGPVIQATERSEFEDGLGAVDFVSGYSYHMSVRTRLSDHTKQTKFQSQWPNDVETPVPSISSTEVQQHRDSQYLDG